MKLALDTSAYIAATRGDRNVTMLAESADSVYLPFVVIAELRYGFLRSRHGAREEKFLTSLLAKPNVFPLMPDDTTTRHYATIRLQLATSGKPIPANDIWIAALVVQHALVLSTRDEHFAALPQIPRI